MANFYYFHPSDNVAPNATWTVETGVEDPVYPATNVPVFTPDLIAAPGKVTGTTGAWLADFGSAQRVDLVVLQSNIDAGATVHFQMNATNSWGAPTVDQAFTIPAARADGYRRKVFIYLPTKSGYSASGFRYVRIVASTASANPIGIKALLYSRVRQTDRNYRWTIQDTEHQIGIVQKTDAGVRWGYDLNSAPRSWKASTPPNDTGAEQFREWFRACAGGVNVTSLVLDPSVNDVAVGYLSQGGVSIEAPSLVVFGQTNTRVVNNSNTVEWGFEEAAIGDPEWV